ncbi:hypothetical protein [Erythrobacter crassostreae]|uniref:Uncharacterized protein n=1 Tax=Erythrobacter crassostreae TaxID=2828328 RepID=A0A9X1F4L7_9SPHN|nr:hypothetical protein [Erythrobacter crassostrea]MBV7260145.1 hypothetical protein [Erythrobacter crassostrea]
MIKRRILAAFLLMGFAIGSPLFWNDGSWDNFDFGINLILASFGFLFLHHRWKRREARMLTPTRARDIFS